MANTILILASEVGLAVTTVILVMFLVRAYG
jgi:hypothetical protein